MTADLCGFKQRQRCLVQPLYSPAVVCAWEQINKCTDVAAEQAQILSLIFNLCLQKIPAMANFPNPVGFPPSPHFWKTEERGLELAKEDLLEGNMSVSGVWEAGTSGGCPCTAVFAGSHHAALQKLSWRLHCKMKYLSASLGLLSLH